MIATELNQQLDLVARRLRQRKLWRELSLCWAAVAAVGIGLLCAPLAHRGPILLIFAAAGLTGVFLRNRPRTQDRRAVAREVERQRPELQTLLLAALDQRPDPRTGRLNFLQTRVVQQAVAQSRRQQWPETVPSRELAWWRLGHYMGLALAVLLFCVLFAGSFPARGSRALAGPDGVEVTPGNVEIECGTPLTVLARFPQAPAGAVTLRLGTQRTVPLARNLGDPVFGATIPQVDASMVYRVEYAGAASPDYKVTVFDYPKLERADLHLTFPAYTKLPEKTVENTRFASVVEQTWLEWTLRLNKPVASARLVEQDGSVVPLTADLNSPRTLHFTLTAAANRNYQLELTDAEQRKNRQPERFEIKVFVNKAPQVKVRLPANDARFTPIEEVRFDAEVSDDFGLMRTGLSYALAGRPPRTVDFPAAAAEQKTQHLTESLRLEDEGVKPNDLLTWYVWAEDTGPNGAPRRTQSDVHFATVRDFEEIYRQQQSQDAQDEGNPITGLLDMQKQIVQSTWNVRRGETGAQPSADFSKSATLLKKSQEFAIETARKLAVRVSDAEPRALLAQAQTEMAGAAARLGEAESQNALAPLTPALDAENAALRTLLKLSSKEWRVSKSQQGNSPQGQTSPQQMPELDLKKQTDRYETERQPTGESSKAQRKQLQVLSRLRELAQRQRDLNEKLNELRVALQAAKTAEERAELEQQLKRLRDKQQETLADVDQLGQRMNAPEDGARKASPDERQQLEKTREDARRAADELARNNPGNALAAGRRAEQELANLRDEVQKQTASAFAEQLRQMRAEARDLAQAEESIAGKMAGGKPPQEPPGRSLRGDANGGTAGEELARQGERLSKLLDAMRETTQSAESSEPALSRQLLDGVRRADQAQVKETLSQAAALAAQNAAGRGAAQWEARARQGIEALQQDVERAASGALGDETEKLRFAKTELGELTQQLDKEMAGRGADHPPSPGGQPQPGASPGDPGQKPGDGSGQRGKDTPPGRSAQNGATPPGADSQDKGRAENGSPGSDKQTGAQPGQGQTDRQAQGAPASSNEPGRSPADSRQASQGGPASSGNTSPDGGGPRGNSPLTANRGYQGGVFDGGSFGEWSDRMRNVEESVEIPAVRDALAKARETAREIRADYKRRGREPEWKMVRSQVFAPLVEAEARVAAELARRADRDPMAPIERDPVPEKYAEAVRRYYEQLGK